MLTVRDTPTIRNAIMKRLGKEPGIDSVHTTFRKHPGEYIGVDIEIYLQGSGYWVNSTFDLPDPFEHAHLLNEIDQVAEGVKAARKAMFGRCAGLIVTPRVQLAGTGRRGLWAQYGLLRV